MVCGLVRYAFLVPLLVVSDCASGCFDYWLLVVGYLRCLGLRFSGVGVLCWNGLWIVGSGNCLLGGFCFDCGLLVDLVLGLGGFVCSLAVCWDW